MRQRQRLVDLCELQASLVYIVCSSTTRVIFQETSCLKRRRGKKRESSILSPSMAKRISTRPTWHTSGVLQASQGYIQRPCLKQNPSSIYIYFLKLQRKVTRAHIFFLNSMIKGIIIISCLGEQFNGDVYFIRWKLHTIATLSFLLEETQK